MKIKRERTWDDLEEDNGHCDMETLIEQSSFKVEDMASFFSYASIRWFLFCPPQENVKG